ncbi:kinesin-domain-containing protein [Auriscalpium vulgare]|uniref:Kinesin-domain-containing protein n=1 Tax=Auriscalpium vulgare TaxID=40419 RepID=A0ACB8SA82_9AGAM|nr:kinesin-domain-containing protein [Auriscalpium vulgare]
MSPVRVRPPSASEAARLPEPVYDTTIRGDGTLSAPARSIVSTSAVRNVVQIVDDRILTFDPAETDQAKAFVERGFMPPGTKRYKDKRFMFDKVLGDDASQQHVYDVTARPLLQNLLDGYNATAFAYGATGCGKTHTISGTETDPGVIYLAMADLFQRIEDRKDEYSAEVVVTFLEIYNEEIRDLLAEPGTPTPRGGLQIREDKAVKVVGLVELRPRSADEVKDIVILGNSRRTQSPTHANETSSRSHAVLQVHVTQAPRTASLTEERTMGTLSIIDLAGSERAAATNNMGQRMVEGANINKSLLALGNCINALCESGGAIRHIPYRNSKLTRLLKFSLGGNCKTVMIVCVAPTSLHFDDTHNTLIYAERATKIKTRVVTRNVVNVDRHVGQYVEAINRLNLEVAELKAKLAGKVTSETEVVRRKKSEAQAEVDRAKNDMKARAEQTQSAIQDGALCSGKLSSAQIKIRVIRARLHELERLASSSDLSPDLEAERGLLQALAVPEEQAVKSDSQLSTRLQRSLNASSMFEAMLRAVVERRSDRLDTVSVDNINLDAQWRMASMERIRAEAEREAVKEEMEGQAKMLLHLLGMVGRYTAVLGEASRSLRTALEEGRDGLDGTARAVAASLKNISERNDGDFQSIVSHSVASYAVAPEAPSVLPIFKGHPKFGRVSSLPGDVSNLAKVKPSRRSSSYGTLGLGSPARKQHVKSPRRSLRSSMSANSAPYRRPSDKEREKKKAVQWKDEAGQGSLDDANRSQLPTFSLNDSTPIAVAPSPDGKDVFSVPGRSAAGGSESEWEDEKTDDSLHFSFSAQSSHDIPPSRTSISRARRDNRSGTGSMRSRGPFTLGSLAEDDENGEGPSTSARRSEGVPLSDRSLNSFTSEEPSPALGSVSKHDRRILNSPRRQPTAPRIAGGAAKTSRRRSNIGPMRNDKGRRRSSLIPQLSPHSRDDDGLSKSASSMGGPRRVPMGESTRSPAKRGKRMSLLNLASKGMSSTRSKPIASGNISFSAGDISASADISGRSKPTWK